MHTHVMHTSESLRAPSSSKHLTPKSCLQTPFFTQTNPGFFGEKKKMDAYNLGQVKQ